MVFLVNSFKVPVHIEKSRKLKERPDLRLNILQGDFEKSACKHQWLNC